MKKLALILVVVFAVGMVSSTANALTVKSTEVVKVMDDTKKTKKEDDKKECKKSDKKCCDKKKECCAEKKESCDKK